MLINAYLGLHINLDNYTFAPRLPQAEQTLFFSYGHGTGNISDRWSAATK